MATRLLLLLLLLSIVPVLLALPVARAYAEIRKSGSGPAPAWGHVAVLSGRVTDVDAHDITIIQDGHPIRVKTGSYIREGRDFRDYFTEGMVITVEGARRGENEIIASRVTPGPYYDTLQY